MNNIVKLFYSEYVLKSYDYKDNYRWGIDVLIELLEKVENPTYAIKHGPGWKICWNDSSISIRLIIDIYNKKKDMVFY